MPAGGADSVSGTSSRPTSPAVRWSSQRHATRSTHSGGSARSVGAARSVRRARRRPSTRRATRRPRGRPSRRASPGSRRSPSPSRTRRATRTRRAPRPPSPRGTRAAACTCRSRACPRTPVMRTRSSGEVLELRGREVGDDVGREVPRRVVHLVQQLVAQRVGRDPPARARRLRDHRGAVGVDGRDRVRQVPRVRQRPPVARVVAAEALARALEQVADEDAGGEPVPVVPRPAVLVRERREEQRRVGDAAR